MSEAAALEPELTPEQKEWARQSDAFVAQIADAEGDARWAAMLAYADWMRENPQYPKDDGDESVAFAYEWAARRRVFPRFIDDPGDKGGIRQTGWIWQEPRSETEESSISWYHWPRMRNFPEVLHDALDSGPSPSFDHSLREVAYYLDVWGAARLMAPGPIDPAQIVESFPKGTPAATVATALSEAGFNDDGELMWEFGCFLTRARMSDSRSTWLVIQGIDPSFRPADVCENHGNGWTAIGEGIRIAGCRTAHEAARKWLESYRAGQSATKEVAHWNS